MAEDKKGFVLYADYNELFSELSNEEAGQLIKHIFKYVNDEDPTPENQTVKLSFIPIKQQLKRDLKKWEGIREKRSLAGKASAEKRKQNVTKPTHVESVEQTSTNPTVSVNDNVTVNVNGKVKVKEIYKSFAHMCLLDSEFEALKNKGYSKEQIDDMLLSIENYKQNTKYKSLNLTLQKWLKKEYPNTKPAELNIDNYEIPRDHHFGYSIEQLIERIKQGKYSLK